VPWNPDTTKIDCQIPDGFRLMIPFNAEYEKEGEVARQILLDRCLSKSYRRSGGFCARRRTIRLGRSRAPPSMRMIQTTDELPNTDA